MTFKFVQNIGKMDRRTCDRKFDTEKEIEAVIWIYNRIVSLITNFEDIRRFTKGEKIMKDGMKKVAIPSSVALYNECKIGEDLFDNLMDAYFSSIQGKK
ncbi:hypothetical protein AVEN_93323-1 [Araneus ventricosus]|uniref:PiggyBac transposable element-derived protein domain-containing protein n=1 Tax=Araneus ventricosus TaxID=182803 RepID=A0A4Y2W050_ARAVE|nr:hypothetical protein AVEN_93323-1 [Araneus ventricosus]